MYSKHKKINRIIFNSITSVSEDGADYEDCYDAIVGKAYCFTDDQNEWLPNDESDEYDEDLVAGEIHAKFFSLEMFHGSIYDLFDSISDECSELISFYSEDGFPKKNVLKTINKNNEDYLGYENLIYLESLKVKTPFRGMDIGKILIRNLINDHCRDASLIYLKAFPKQYSGHESWSADEKEKAEKINNKEFKGRSLTKSQSKLIKLYSECGFKLIQESKEHMVMDLNSTEYLNFINDYK